MQREPCLKILGGNLYRRLDEHRTGNLMITQLSCLIQQMSLFFWRIGFWRTQSVFYAPCRFYFAIKFVSGEVRLRWGQLLGIKNVIVEDWVGCSFMLQTHRIPPKMTDWLPSSGTIYGFICFENHKLFERFGNNFISFSSSSIGKEMSEVNPSKFD